MNLNSIFKLIKQTIQFIYIFIYVYIKCMFYYNNNKTYIRGIRLYNIHSWYYINFTKQ